MSIVNTVLIAIFSALFGGWIGYRFTLNSDKRRDYNAISDRIYKSITSSSFLNCKDDITIIKRIMNRRESARLNRAIAEYEKCTNNTERAPDGQVIYKDYDSIQKSLKMIAKAIPRK